MGKNADRLPNRFGAYIKKIMLGTAAPQPSVTLDSVKALHRLRAQAQQQPEKREESTQFAVTAEVEFSPDAFGSDKYQIGFEKRTIPTRYSVQIWHQRSD